MVISEGTEDRGMDKVTFAKLSELEDDIDELSKTVRRLQKQVDTNEASLRQMAADLIALKNKVG